MREVESYEFAQLRSRTEAEEAAHLHALSPTSSLGVAGRRGQGSGDYGGSGPSAGAGEGGQAGPAAVVVGAGGAVLRVAMREKREIRPAAKLLPAVRVISTRDGGLAPALQSPTGRGSAELGEPQPSVESVKPLPQDAVAPKKPRLAELADTALPAGGEEGGAGDEGLQGLLGGYASSSEDGINEDDRKPACAGQQAAAVRNGGGNGLLLPSADVLLQTGAEASVSGVPNYLKTTPL
ncbi:hypothetical protein V8C86DRAFT_3144582 [Haematococcus lacustris]